MPQARAIVGEKDVRPIKNETGAEIAKSVFVALDPTDTVADPPLVTLPSLGGEVYGVNISSQVRVDVTPDGGLPDTEIGDCQVDGVAVVIASGAIALQDPIAATAAGLAIAAVSGNIVIGKAVVPAADTEEVEVALAGAGQSYILP